MEIHIESAPSLMNPHLYVSLKKGQYQLCTAHAIYSYGEKYVNFKRAFSMLKHSRRKFPNVLLLGFGLGSVALLLEKQFPGKYRFTGVDADETVTYLAHHYGLPLIQSPVELVISDAYPYVFQCEEKFDLIAMDVFLDDKVPAMFEEEKFVDRLACLLAKGGIVFYNRLAYSQKDKSNTEAFFTNVFKKVFPESYSLDVGGNRMLISDRSALNGKVA